jgi:hypothetical protein
MNYSGIIGQKSGCVQRAHDGRRSWGGIIPAPPRTSQQVLAWWCRAPSSATVHTHCRVHVVPVAGQQGDVVSTAADSSRNAALGKPQPWPVRAGLQQGPGLVKLNFQTGVSVRPKHPAV